MSVLEEAPMDRIPIQTYVMEYQEEMVREAISREMARGGQVYYVYNRVNDIDEVTNRIAKLVPEANVAFAHGQMNEALSWRKSCIISSTGKLMCWYLPPLLRRDLTFLTINTIIIHDGRSDGTFSAVSAAGPGGAFKPDGLRLSDVPEK